MKILPQVLSQHQDAINRLCDDSEGLELIFQRPVNLVTRQAMKNPVFRDTVDSTS